MNATTEEQPRLPNVWTLQNTIEAVTWQIFLRWVLALGIPLLAGFQLWHLVTWTPYELAIHGVFLDDAYFYSVLARNFHKFGFLTLDGEMPTNGFQPLWMGLQLVLTGFWPGVDEVFLLSRSSWACYVLFSYLSIRFLTRLAPSLTAMSLAGAIMGGLILLNVKFQQLVVKGLETPLLLVVLLLTLLMIDHTAKVKLTRPAGHLPIQNVIGLALISCLCFFARTDLFWAPLITGGWLLITAPGRRRSLLVYLGVVSLLVLPYLVTNYFTHAALMPISGRVKLHYLTTFYSHWNDYLSSEEWHGVFFAVGNSFLSCEKPSPVSIALTIGMLMAGQGVVWRNRNSQVFPTSIRLFSLVIIGHVLLLYLFYRELRSYSAYYFAPELLWAVTVLTLCAIRRCHHLPGLKLNFPGSRLLDGGGRVIPPALALLSIGLMMNLWREQRLEPSPYWVGRMQIIHDMERILPQAGRVSAFWPGLFAQFSNKLVTPLDGIIGSNDFFQQYVKPGREFNYVLERSRPYVIVFLTAPPDHLCTQPKPSTTPWYLGMTRVWERGQAGVRILAARPVNAEGGGWYLLELKEPSSPVQ